MAEIAGIVFDSVSNAPIDDATVVATDKYPTGRRRRYVANLTNAAGEYTIPNLPNSEFEIRASKHPDYTPNRAGSVQVDLRTRNRVTDINIPLTPRRPPQPPTPREIDVGQRPHPELGDERAWKQRTGNIPGETFKTESQVSGPGGGPIETRSEVSGPGGAPIQTQTEISGELKITQGDREEKARLGVIVHEEGNRRAPVKRATVTVSEVGQSNTTDDRGITQFYVPVGRSYTIHAVHDDYRDNVVRSPRVEPRRGAVVFVPLTPKRFGRIRGVVADETGKLIPNARIELTGPSGTIFNTPDGRFDFKDLQPGVYKLSVSHPQYETIENQSSAEIDLEVGQTERKNLRLKRKRGFIERRKEEAKAGKGLSILAGKWWRDNWLRFVFAGIITIALVIAFWGPFFSKLGQQNLILMWLVPIVFYWAIFFTFPHGEDQQKQWGHFIAGGLLAGITLFALWVWGPDFVKGANFILFGVPLAVYFYVTYFAKNKGLPQTLTQVIAVLLVIGGIMLIWNLITSGAAFNIETYLKAIDVLHLVGVPQDTIDSVKDGIRSVLSFLQFKGAEPLKPEAKKIGGFEAIQLKFGSTYNDFLLPTLFARMDYTLPVTVTNPNKFDTKLVVKGFTIEDMFLKNRTDNRILCGINDTYDVAPAESGRIVLGDIMPEEERITTIQFSGKTTQKGGNPIISPAEGATVDCREVLKYKSTAPQNPMYPDKFSQTAQQVIEKCGGDKDPFPDFGGKATTRQKCRNLACEEECIPTVDKFNTKYKLPSRTASPSGNQLDSAKYIESSNQCECKVKKYYNIMDNLCFMDKAGISLRSSYDFNVQGKGELLLTKTDADRKLAPKPTITSGAGPLTVTTYFVSDVHVPEKIRTSIMFIQITNDGDGNAQINEIIIDYQKPTYQKIDGLEIEQCSPMPDKSKNVAVTVTEDGTTISCPVKIVDGKIVNAITGGYRTVPIIVDVDYTYSQTHSTTVNVKKEIIPESITDPDKINELKRQFEPLPYYCPSDLQIYPT